MGRKKNSKQLKYKPPPEPVRADKAFQKGCRQKMRSKLKGFDVYGEQISLTYQGDDTYKTVPGASVSIVVFAVILAYAAYRSLILFTLEDTKVSKKSFLRDLDQEAPLRPFDMGFDVAFGIGAPIDPSLAYMSARLVDFYYANNSVTNATERIRVRTSLKLDLCSNVGYNFSDQKAVNTYGFNQQYCIKDKEKILL